MQFIKSAFQKLWLIIAVILLASCASVPEQEAAETLVDAEAQEDIFVVLPNPYFLNPQQVPEQARLEFARVKQAMAEQDWPEAQAQLDLMIATFPKLSGPYVNLGIVLLNQDNVEDAEKAFRFAIETNALNFDAYDHLGKLLREQGRFDEAEQVYLSALALWPHHLASVKNLGVLYDLYMGRFQEALTYYELALLIDGGENRQLKGWVFDTKRRIAEQN